METQSIVTIETEIDYLDYATDDSPEKEKRVGAAYEIGNDFDNDCF